MMTTLYAQEARLESLERMFPEESDMIEKYIGGLPDMIHGSVMATKPKTMQDAIEFATELMDKKIQPFKRHNVARAYTARPGDKKPYRGSKCNTPKNACRSGINLQGDADMTMPMCQMSNGNECTKLEFGQGGKTTQEYRPRVTGTDVVGYNQRFQELSLMCSRMFPEESDEIEKYVGGLSDMIHGSVMASKPKTMQDAIEFTTELMDQNISTLAERQAENKRKFEDTSRNNQNQQQPFKRHNVARAYTAGPGDKKPYRGSNVTPQKMRVAVEVCLGELLHDTQR
ncbi:hypothetical protein Tco_0988037 [Tanacetum coccineum]|uniref:Reverse transcriptase domain-containing protein n=1 Tax=Tanacetum coccineum TaxID=301880 RepID=A0ABQ5EQK5_9ASTR